jgi:hypothetical protein
LVEVTVEKAWRLHSDENPLRVSVHPTGRFRFDAPTGEYAVTYANLDQYACFAEVYGDEQEIPPTQVDRRLSFLTSARPLRLIQLDDGPHWSSFGLDMSICSSVDYARTQLWSKRLHEWYPDADGIRYLGRHAGVSQNLCLYLDRCADAMSAELEGRLGELRSLVMKAADVWSLAPRIFDSESPSTPL